MSFLAELTKAAQTGLTFAPTRYIDAVVTGNAHPSSIEQATGLNRWGLVGASILQLPDADNEKLFEAGFLDNHVVWSIANWTARAKGRAPMCLYDTKDKAALKKFRGYTAKQQRQEYTLRAKAMEQVANTNSPLLALLEQPNEGQDWQEFMYALSVYKDFGNALVLGNRLDAGKNKGQIRELTILPTAYYMGQNPTVAGYQQFVDRSGTGTIIEGADVLHLRNFNGDTRQGQTQLWGRSKLASARRLLAQSSAGMDAQAEAMQNRGARVIIFPKNINGVENEESTPEQLASATDAIRRKLARAGSGGIAANGTELGMIQLGMSPVDLNILESGALTTAQLCGLWGVSPITVFPTAEGTTYANMPEANEASIRNGVLYDLEQVAKGLNRWLVPGYSDTQFIEPDLDVYDELQEDKAKMAEWLSACVLSPNDYNEAMGFPRSDYPGMDIPMMRVGYQPITDMLAQPQPGSNADQTY